MPDNWFFKQSYDDFFERCREREKLLTGTSMTKDSGAVSTREMYVDDMNEKIDAKDARVAELEAAMHDLLRATSNSVVMRPSERDAWLRAEAILLRVPLHPPRP